MKSSNKKPNPYLVKCSSMDNFVKEPEALKGDWSIVFGNNKPVFLDIGCGNGDFIVGTAKNHQDYNFIGMDLASKFLYKAVKKGQKSGLNNLKFIYYNAKEIEKIFDPSCLEGVFLLFSDPYKKSRQLKHRVVGQNFLAKVAMVMKPGRFLVIKTDDSPYFDAISAELAGSKDFKVITRDYDFASSEYSFDMITTHYERKFSSKKIKWLLAVKHSF